MMDVKWQQTVDWLSQEIQYEESSIGGSCINLDWGNYTIECGQYPLLKEALVRLVKDYRRLRALELEENLVIMRKV